MDSDIATSLVELRKLLTQHNLEAYVIPRTDPHNVPIPLISPHTG